jgi:hypothetical protein
MITFELSELTRKRARRNAALVKRTKSWNPYGPKYNRDTIMQCPKHHVDYVLRYSARKAPTLLMYDCPEGGCFNTFQVAKK